MKKKAVEKIPTACHYWMQRLTRLIQPTGLIRRVKRRIRHKADYFLISNSGV